MDAGRYQVLPKQSYEAAWFFEYADGKKREGIFNYTGEGSDSAFSQPKENLVRAGIIARCGNRRKTTVINCTGQDFCNFLWVAGKSALTGRSSLLGLTLVARNESATFNFDGSLDIVKRDNKEDKFFHYGRA